MSGKGNPSGASGIVEEPILFLMLARRLGVIEPGQPLNGSFMVYDFGGGSFDSALVEIEAGNSEMAVYGADGHPLLGGSDIDGELKKSLVYRGQWDLLRKAKEGLTSAGQSANLQDGTVITLEDVNRAIVKLGVVDKSLMAMRDAYIGAKVLWKRGEGINDPPVGEIITKDENGSVRFVWQLTWDELAGNVEKIILFGGPTRSPHIYNKLSERFGADKIITASELLPTLTGTPNLELVGISMGACYSYQTSYSPLYINRLPVRVTLEDLDTGAKAEYKPFQILATPPRYRPVDAFVSKGLSRPMSTIQTSLYPQTYQLTITHPNGLVSEQRFIDNKIDPRLIGHELRLVIDRFGRVGVEQSLGKVEGAPETARSSRNTNKKTFTILETTPWQTGGQLESLQRLFEQQRIYEQRQREKGLLNVNRLPWQYPTP